MSGSGHTILASDIISLTHKINETLETFSGEAKRNLDNLYTVYNQYWKSARGKEFAIRSGNQLNDVARRFIVRTHSNECTLVNGVNVGLAAQSNDEILVPAYVEYSNSNAHNEVEAHYASSESDIITPDLDSSQLIADAFNKFKEAFVSANKAITDAVTNLSDEVLQNNGIVALKEAYSEIGSDAEEKIQQVAQEFVDAIKGEANLNAEEEQRIASRFHVGE